MINYKKYMLYTLSLLLLILFIIINAINTIFAAGSEGTSGADFLEIGVGSRPLGMGEAFTAEVNDINAIYYNPAGLATLKFPVMSIMHQELILDSRFENISLALPLYGGFFGFSTSVFWVPPFDKIDINGNKVGTVTFYNVSGILSYGYSLGFMEIGGSFKYIYQKIDTLQLHSVAFDVGILKRITMYSPFDAPIKNLSFGLSVQNIGTNANDDSLPRLIRGGVSYKMSHFFGINVDFIENAINSSDLYDFTSGFNESFRVNTGIELNYLDILFFRTGYRFNDAGTYTFGMGFNYAIKNVAFVIDASYQDAGVFGPIYSFTVTFKLIPRVITIEDKLKAEAHYQRGIKYFITDDIDGALEEFKKASDYDPYHKNVDKKIKDLEELKELKRQNELLEKEQKTVQ